MDDVFGRSDDEEFYDDDDPFATDHNFFDGFADGQVEVHESIDTSKAYSLPWKSPHAIFFTQGFFEREDWMAGSGSAPFGPGAVQVPTSECDYFEANFEILEILGRGSFSDVFRVRRKMDNMVLALKRSRAPFSGIVDRFRRVQEVENMWRASGHPHCIQILESWEQHGYLFILMELCDNGRYYFRPSPHLIHP
jgi:serine/threonine protein kinase